MSDNGGEYRDYLQREVQLWESGEDEGRRMTLVEAAGDRDVRTVLDVGCGAGQEMLSFASLGNTFCVGIDRSADAGSVGKGLFARYGLDPRAAFLCSVGERLPIADGSVDVLICRVALPYMGNRDALSEFARVLRPDGVIFLKIHSPYFYLLMLKDRLKTLDLKQIAYPVICIFGSLFYLFTGRQIRRGFLAKEVFRTMGALRKDLKQNNLRIEDEMADSSAAGPSFKIVKIG